MEKLLLLFNQMIIKYKIFGYTIQISKPESVNARVKKLYWKRKRAGMCVQCRAKAYNGRVKCRKHLLQERAMKFTRNKEFYYQDGKIVARKIITTAK